jgi:hypothetical protein
VFNTLYLTIGICVGHNFEQIFERHTLFKQIPFGIVLPSFNFARISSSMRNMFSKNQIYEQLYMEQFEK